LKQLSEAGVETILLGDRKNPVDPEWLGSWGQSIEMEQSWEESLLPVLQQTKDKPHSLLWIETDRLLPPWEVSEDLFEQYIDVFEELLLNEPEDQDEYLYWPDPATGPWPENQIADLQRTFAAVITAFDDDLGSFLDVLRTHANDSLWLFTSGFGYPLTERGYVGLHRPWLHEELVHIPLIVRLPQAEQAGRRVNILTQPIDLLPTLFEAFGLPIPDVDGKSLWQHCQKLRGPVRDYAVAGLTVGEATEVMLRTVDEHFLWPLRIPEGDPARGQQYFLKPDDRWEVNDLRQHHLERCEELEHELRRHIEGQTKDD
jgi:arylsulfatase A-like enzyme